MVTRIISESSKQLREDSPDAVDAAVRSLALDISPLPEQTGLSGLFSNREINDILDLLYIDILTQYFDLYGIEDAVHSASSFMRSLINGMISEATRIRLKSEALVQMLDTTNTDTYVESQTFSQAGSSESSLTVDPLTRSLTLSSLTEEINDEAEMDVRITAASSGVCVAYESPAEFAFSGDPVSPYFLHLLTNGPCDNTEIDAVNPGSGLYAEIIITFPESVSFTDIVLNIISGGPLRVIGVRSHENSQKGTEWSALTSVDEFSYRNELGSLIIRCSRTNAREIHVLVENVYYELTDNDTVIPGCPGIHEMRNHLKSVLQSVETIGIPEGKSLRDSLQILKTKLLERIDVPLRSYPGGMRSYLVGVYGVRVSNRSYWQNGEWMSKDIERGHFITSAAIIARGSLDIWNNSVVDAAVVPFLQIGSSTFRCKAPDNDGRITDIVTLSYNRGTDSSSYPVYFTTSFLPETDNQTFWLHYDGKVGALTSSDMASTYTRTGLVIKIESGYLLSSGLTAGMTIACRYVPSETDLHGLARKTDRVNIVNEIGYPHIANRDVFYNTSRYLFVSDTVNGRYTSYAPGEYALFEANDGVMYYLGDGKGEDTSASQFVVTSGTVYVSGTSAVMAPSALYCGHFDQSVTDTGSTVEVNGYDYRIYQTAYPYMKGTLNVSVDHEPERLIMEYGEDTATAVLNNDARRLFSVRSDRIGEVSSTRAHFMPINYATHPENIVSNFAPYTNTEQHYMNMEDSLTLESPVFVDPVIIDSDEFGYHDGVFSYLPFFSVVYEPVLVYVNGIRAHNMTEYGDRDIYDPGTVRDNVYGYIVSDRQIVFNRQVEGTVMVYYYTWVRSYLVGFSIARVNTFRDDLTPEVTGFTITESSL